MYPAVLIEFGLGQASGKGGLSLQSEPTRVNPGLTLSSLAVIVG